MIYILGKTHPLQKKNNTAVMDIKLKPAKGFLYWKVQFSTTCICSWKRNQIVYSITYNLRELLILSSLSSETETRGTINVLLFKESVFKYFIRPKKTIPDGNAESVDGKQVRFIGQLGNGMLHVNGFVDYSPRLNNAETYLTVR